MDQGDERERNGGVSQARQIAGTLQDYLALGYLYLLVLGIASDSLFYGALGINIIRYSTVLDVLLSPIVHLTSGLAFPLVIIGIPLVGFIQMRIFARKGGGTVIARLGSASLSVTPVRFWLLFSSTVILSAYIGLGLGGGQAVKSALASGDLWMNHHITFQDESVERVHLVGNNSTYAFYVVEGQRVVTVSPIQENIRSIQRIQPES